MRQFMLDINSRYQRPVIQLKSWYNMEALLDTGAFFPVWTADEDILNILGGICIKRNVSFGGFGGKASGNLYELRGMRIGSLVFPSIHIVACRDLKDVPFQLILSATMFRGLIYEIDDRNHKLNVTVPDEESMVRNLVIKDSGGKLHIMCESIFQEDDPE